MFFFNNLFTLVLLTLNSGIYNVFAYMPTINVRTAASAQLNFLDKVLELLCQNMLA